MITMAFGLTMTEVFLLFSDPGVFGVMESDQKRRKRLGEKIVLIL